MSKNLKLFQKLKETYPDAHCELLFSNPFELLVATILSAQCTDERVNMVTPVLFKHFPSPEKMMKASQEEIEKIIHSTGFYRNKAKNIKESARMIVEEFGGKVPETMNELITLPGAARKTANVVLWNSFGKNEGVVVDTHVSRLSQRIGFTKNTDVKKIEKDLMKLIPKNDWGIFSHVMIAHGRKVCKARKPECGGCVLKKDCKKVGV